MNRNEKNTEKIKMFANSLVQKCADNGIKAVAVVSSELDCGYLSSLMEKVKAFLAEKGEKLTLISFDESSINDLSELEKALESGENGLVAAVIPSFGDYANSFVAAKKIGTVCLVEREKYTEYKKLEELLASAQSGGFKILGTALVK